MLLMPPLSLYSKFTERIRTHINRYEKLPRLVSKQRSYELHVNMIVCTHNPLEKYVNKL